MAITRVTGAQTIRTYSGATFLVNNSSSFELQRLDTGKMAAVWGTGTATSESLNVTTLNALGGAPTAIQVLETVNTTRTVDLPIVASAPNGGFLVVWDNDTSADDEPFLADAFGRLFSAAGAPLGAKFALSTATTGGEFTPSVARLGNGNFYTTWSDTRATTLANLDIDALGRIVGPTGAPIGGEVKVNIGATSQIGTDALALPDGRAVTVWATATINPALEITFSGLRGRFISPTGTPTGAEFAVDAITPGSSYGAFDGAIDVLGLGNGGFAVVWQQSIDPEADGELHFQRFTSTGAKLGAEFVVETATDQIESFSAVELANGGFAVEWRTFDNSSSTGANFIRVFNMNGVEIGTETSLTAIGGPGLANIYDLELMSNGRVMALGSFNGNASVGTQVFDFGDERLIGTAAANILFGKEGVNDQILGQAGNDRLTGLSGNDTLDGGAGADTLIGGLGKDTMTGGTQRDVFDFNAVAETGRTPATRDLIKDFEHSTDDIDLRTIDANGSAAGNTAFSFLGAKGAAFTGAKGQLHWFQAGGQTFVEGDVDGNKVADFQIQLAGLKVLTFGDFLL